MEECPQTRQWAKGWLLENRGYDLGPVPGLLESGSTMTDDVELRCVEPWMLRASHFFVKYLHFSQDLETCLIPKELLRGGSCVI